jgi:Chaperone of endosialidase
LLGRKPLREWLQSGFEPVTTVPAPPVHQPDRDNNMRSILRQAFPFVSLVVLIPAARAQSAPTYSNASLSGTYSLVDYLFDSTTPQSPAPAAGTPLPAPVGFTLSLGTITFDGAGNATLSITGNVSGIINGPTPGSFTYSVASNGAISTSAGLSGTLVENGKVLLGGDLTSGDPPQIILLVRQEDGSDNTATGANALPLTTTGVGNTADGAFSLFSNTSANYNTAVGYQALYANTTGVSNTAAGAAALQANSTGANNTAYGANALYSNTVGKGNAAQGVNALYNNTTGIRNLGIGSNALFANSSGSYNIALGFDAGYNVTTGSNNIEIGAQGASSDNNTIQIGAQGTQTSTTIAGIYGTTLTGSAVYVTPSGQLGVLASSERYKTDVSTMAEASGKLEQLRPVTFKLKNDPHGTTQYGLIAEEVAKVYPELVIRGADGRIDGVRYEELSPMLLNVIQQQQTRLDDQTRQIEDLQQRITAAQELEKRFEQLNHQALN